MMRQKISRPRIGAWLQRIGKSLVFLGVICLVGVSIGLIIAIVGGYLWGWEWTGVSSYIGPVLKPNQPYRPEKTLWDWLQLLIAPIVLLLLGVGFAQWQQKRDHTIQQQRYQADQELALDNQRESVLQDYINKISELLLDKQLRSCSKEAEAQKIARVRVLTVLPRLDANRKRSVVQFLYESGLINREKPVVDLASADLSDANLSDLNLSAAKLSGADLRRADLSDANLRRADLCDCDLRRANLRRADLSDALLRNTNLINADLRRADLSNAFLVAASLNRANLSNANLRRADLTNAYLSGADLSGAKLSDAYLSRADLRGARLSEADLSRADLNEANLSSANLSKADLWKAVLVDADLRKADLGGANLHGADLQHADLREARLAEADLSDANLRGANLAAEQWTQARSLASTVLPDGSLSTQS
ncbi:pentapeptide repeat-containing protein [Thermogemmatispora sp.]|uniref:pentapeptide repeat-containing protein n=1 Tax=Thermogemmatispora sp. TaxID=1968838 RepID=UPI002580AA98|nr:pentapeptide repeat-containing protein [Thermogemmatispora sp.]